MFVPVCAGLCVHSASTAWRGVACYAPPVSAGRERATYEALAGLPEGVKAEVIAGVVETGPTPLPRQTKT
jgi:hypothetical protein